jgi:diketogulonate reductase-like aldo/keto reductase
LLLHAPDPRVSLSTTARALARAHERGLAQRVGASNVSRKQLEEIAACAPVSAVEVALGAYDDLALRGGVVAYCFERGIEVFAHAPLGGPKGAAKFESDVVLRSIGARLGRSPIDVFLAYLLCVSEKIVPIVGARSRATIDRWVAASDLVLDEDDTQYVVRARIRK